MIRRRPSTPTLPTQPDITLGEPPSISAPHAASDDDEVVAVESVSLHGSFSIRKRKGATVAVDQQEDIEAERANQARVEAELAQYYPSWYAQTPAPAPALPVQAHMQATDPALMPMGMHLPPYQVQQYGQNFAIHQPIAPPQQYSPWAHYAPPPPHTPMYTPTYTPMYTPMYTPAVPGLQNLPWPDPQSYYQPAAGNPLIARPPSQAYEQTHESVTFAQASPPPAAAGSQHSPPPPPPIQTRPWLAAGRSEIRL